MTRRPFLIAAVALGYLWAGQGDLEQARAKTYTPPPVVEQPEAPAPEQPVAPPVESTPPVVTPPAQAVEPLPVIVPVAPVAVAAPRDRLGGSIRLTTATTRCRIYATRPARAVGHRTTPRYGQVRVRRGADGRLYGYSDTFRIVKTTFPSGAVRIRVTWTPGTYCGPLLPRGVAG